MKDFLINYINSITYNLYLTFGYYKQAETLLKQALEMNLSKESKTEIANLLVDMNASGKLGKVDHDQIVKYAKMAYEITPENPLHLENLAFAYSNAGHYKEAEPLFKKILTMDFSNEDKASTAYRLGLIYNNGLLGEADHNQAVTYYQIAHIFSPENPLHLKSLVTAYSNAGHHKEAESILKQALEMNWSNEYKAYAANQLGFIYSKRLLDKADHDQAIKYYQIAHELNPEKTLYLKNLAAAHLDVRHYEEAESIFKQALETNWSNKDKAYAAHQLGLIYSKGLLGEADYNQAIKYYQIAHMFDPKDSFHLQNLAVVYSNAGHYKEAESIFKQILETNVNNRSKAFAANKLGFIYNEGKLGEADHSQAIKYYQIADKLSPDSLYLNKLAIALSNAKHYSEAELKLKECTETDYYYFRKAECASNLASLYKDEKIAHPYHESASYYFNLAHEVDPSNPVYIHHLAMEYYATGNYEEAEPLLEQCIETSINDDKNECAYSLQYLHEHSL